MIPYHWLGPDAEREMAEHLAKVQADAAALRKQQGAEDG